MDAVMHQGLGTRRVLSTDGISNNDNSTMGRLHRISVTGIEESPH